MAEFKLPDVGEGLTEAEIVSWKVKEGDTVEINDIIVEIETAKSLVELPSPYAGTVQKLMVARGRDGPGRDADHRDRRRRRARRRPMLPSEDARPRRWRSTSPTPPPAVAARARAWSAATRPTAARCGAPAGVPRRAGRCQAR